MIRVAAVSGGRSDFGLLRPTLERLRDDRRFELLLLVSAMHLDDAFGDTLGEVAAAGLDVAARVLLPEADDIAARLGAGVTGFRAALLEAQADLLLVLGDRHEALAAALAASGLGVPIAHLHGGEVTEGSMDDAMRHCITKLAHVHFPAARVYGERLVQLGEDPARVHVVGASGIEAIRDLPLLERDELEAQLGRPLASPLVALTLHPESLDGERSAELADAVTGAVEEVLGERGSVIVTLPNDDPGNAPVRERLVSLAERAPNVAAHAALGQLRYLSLLRHADAALGNSSSALIEAPAFELPVVDVGERQRGRLRPPNVLHADATRAAVGAALARALDPAFRIGLAGMRSPYGSGDVSRRVVEVLAGLPPAAELRRKRFHDLDGPWRTALALEDAP